ncbi:hypothetical protein DSAG12_00315 [Promethearchaeum syntrophicum]|uniref:Uncharacterized protein n=1 Tax=Promethearchaeum syntrophicum TaxID=2594042 RepID=A0A5B9D639_9ARCH|nr:hypothetical protein [Candidatus Prometheoarchaeum syntrophicum]QEE14502.1 hypothetical protein DSAG12_00315 [Candidatus Prometheoarchaeum syntrophicum]
MKNNNLDSEGTFLSISENYPIIDALRSYLNIDQKFPNLTFSRKKSEFEETSNNNIDNFPESQILNELN